MFIKLGANTDVNPSGGPGSVFTKPKPVSNTFGLAQLQNFVPFLLDLEKANLPPLLKSFSWTLTSPFKEEKFQRLVSDSIGNNFTPLANDINMKTLVKEDEKGKPKLPKVIGSEASSPPSRPLSPISRKEAIKVNEPLQVQSLKTIDLDPVDVESVTIAKQVRFFDLDNSSATLLVLRGAWYQ